LWDSGGTEHRKAVQGVYSNPQKAKETGGLSQADEASSITKNAIGRNQPCLQKGPDGGKKDKWGGGGGDPPGKKKLRIQVGGVGGSQPPISGGGCFGTQVKKKDTQRKDGFLKRGPIVKRTNWGEPQCQEGGAKIGGGDTLVGTFLSKTISVVKSPFGGGGGDTNSLKQGGEVKENIQRVLETLEMKTHHVAETGPGDQKQGKNAGKSGKGLFHRFRRLGRQGGGRWIRKRVGEATRKK